MAIFPSAVATDSDLYIAVNNIVTDLTAGIDDFTLTIPVTSTAAFPSDGCITIGTEIIKYTSKTATQFNASTRGFDGTVAASHSSGDDVHQFIIAAHHNVLKDEVKAIEQNLSDRLGLSATQNIIPVGSAAAPSLTFAGDLDTGIYADGTANRINFSAGGDETCRVEADKFRVLTGHNLVLGTTSVIYAESGTAALPVYSFTDDPDCGLYRSAANELSFALNGSQFLKLSNATSILSADYSVSQFGFSVRNAGTTGSYVDCNNASARIIMGAMGTQAGTFWTGGPAYANASYFQNVTGTNWVHYNAVANTYFYSTQATALWKFVRGSNTEIVDIHADGFRTRGGTVSAPGISYLADPDTGFYNNGSNQLLATCGGVFCGQFIYNNSVARFQVPDGTVTYPGLSFDNDQNTGIYRYGTDQIGFTTSGAVAWTISGGGNLYGRGTSSSIYVQDGTVSFPSFSFMNDSDTGMYLAGAGLLSFASDGILKMWFSGATCALKNGTVLSLEAGSAATPSLTFNGDTNTGIYWVSADAAELTAGGALIATWRNDVGRYFEPGADNAVGLGRSGVRWTSVWAVNGTIQTSMSCTKENIIELQPEECSVPIPAKFNRPGEDPTKPRLGWIGDDLPDEAHPVDENGNRVSDCIYTDAVLAQLCLAARNDYERLAAIEARLAALEAK